MWWWYAHSWLIHLELLAEKRLLSFSLYGMQVLAAGDLCAICQEKMHAPILLQCKHIFCEDCASEWYDHLTITKLKRVVTHLIDKALIFIDLESLISCCYFGGRWQVGAGADMPVVQGTGEARRSPIIQRRFNDPLLSAVLENQQESLTFGLQMLGSPSLLLSISLRCAETAFCPGPFSAISWQVGTVDVHITPCIGPCGILHHKKWRGNDLTK